MWQVQALTAVPPSRWVLRLLIAAGAPLAVVLGALAGHPPRPPVVVLVTVLGLAWARRPDAFFGTAASVIVVVWWAQALRAGAPVAVVGAALALTTAHVAALLADLGPERMPLDAEVRRLWLGRGASAVAAAAALWVVAVAARGTPAPGLWVLALLGALLATVATAVVLARSNLD